MILAEKILHCPRCGEIMIYEKQGFWCCPRCDGEFWDDESKLLLLKSEERTRAQEEQLQKQMRWAVGGRYTEVLPLIPVRDYRSSGSRLSRRKRKKPVKRVLDLWQFA
ncbi:MAG: hypothetical protein C4589_11090 [Peptococcaceae bacterium]|nr:MAG: hypothetical protein C4589_11090 [Peptococcaceae bacterium]